MYLFILSIAFDWYVTVSLSTVGGHLGFWFSALVNKTAMSIQEKVFLWAYLLMKCMNEISEFCSKCMFTSRETVKPISVMTNLHFQQQCENLS